MLLKYRFKRNSRKSNLNLQNTSLEFSINIPKTGFDYIIIYISSFLSQKLKLLKKSVKFM